MKIARLLRDNKETYGFVKGDKVSTKDEITYLTGVPIPTGRGSSTSATDSIPVKPGVP